MKNIIAGCITLFVTFLIVIYVSFTARGKGPILSNSYLILSKKERERADKKTEYRFVTVVFSILAILFFMLALTMLTGWIWPRVVMWICIAVEIIYAVVASFPNK